MPKSPIGRSFDGEIKKTVLRQKIWEHLGAMTYFWPDDAFYLYDLTESKLEAAERSGP